MTHGLSTVDIDVFSEFYTSTKTEEGPHIRQHFFTERVIHICNLLEASDKNGNSVTAVSNQDYRSYAITMRHFWTILLYYCAELS